MSSNEILFLRNAEGGVDDDAWNDDVLIALYDKALQVAKKEVAQRIAMETNTKVQKNSSSECTKSDCKETDVSSKTNKKNKKKKSKVWKQGQNCRAVYTEDGVEYEAVIKRILDEDTCIVTYIGYGNEEIQPLSGILPSHGKDDINQQIQMAALHGSVTDDFLQDDSDQAMEEDDPQQPFSGNSNGKLYKKKKNTKAGPSSNFHLPDLPPIFSGVGMDCGLPPPPPMPFLSQGSSNINSGVVAEDKSIYPMLVSWYMSGYYTGLYQGHRMRKRSNNNN